jgi:hypothetical protein
MKRIPLLFMFALTISLAVLVAPAYAHTPSVSAAHCSLPTANTMPSSTIRQQIVDEFKRRLEKIDSSAAPLANGYQYQTDIGKNGVEEWVTHSNEDLLKSAEGQARISVFDQVRTREAKETPDSEGVSAALPVQTRCYHFRDLAPTEVRKHLADMAQAVVTDPDTGERDYTLGGLCVHSEITDDGFVVPSEVFTIEASAIGWNVHHVIDPYEV